MPVGAPLGKVEAVRALGAAVHQKGDSVDACVAQARERAAAEGFAFVHPFDDLEVIAGQAGIGVEIAADVPDARLVLVPIGGGGLASGVAAALKQARPEVEVVGVQAAACAPVAAALAGGGAETPAALATIADGIAVKHPGAITLPLIERWVDRVVTVDEDAIAAAMTLLLDHSKLVVEGAGAASLAALVSGAVAPSESGTTVAVLSGGNVDIGMLASIAAHMETEAGRRGRLFTRIVDRPGNLARLLAAVAEAGANVIAVEHVRDGVALGVSETGVVLTIETRGESHLQRVGQRLRGAGYRLDESLD